MYARKATERTNLIMDNHGTNGVMAVTVGIIAVCVLVYMAQLADPTITQEYALSVMALRNGNYAVLLTSMFMHGGIMHIVMNMMSLWYIAKALRGVMNAAEYSITYLSSGVIGGLTWAYVASQTGDLTSYCVGASGAIFGILGAYGAMLMSMRHDGVNVGSAWQSWIGVLFVNLVYGLTNPGIALSAHVGGLVCGIVLGLVFFSHKHMRLV